MAKANERTFQGILLNSINILCRENIELSFEKITQEEQTGLKGFSKFSDIKLYSSIIPGKIISFELKNISWDATDEELIKDAHFKASMNGYEYFVTGTPRQLIVFKTFEAGKSIFERKLKIFYLPRIQKIDDILRHSYEKEIITALKPFLKELSDIVHGIKEATWATIDEYFTNKLSNFILEASEFMFNEIHEKIKNDKKLQLDINNYLQNQDIFNISMHFSDEDIYNLCQLTNYLFYLKIIFYSYLQREVPKLGLKRISIPDDYVLLNKTLKSRFSDVLSYDYELIFEPTVLDDFIFPNNYLNALRKNIDEIYNLNFKELNVDIIGSIYNTLIDNQEQHDRGQHFTNTYEVDIICGFCINKNTNFILDSGCGAGTFLVRSYHFLKYFNPEYTHQELLERLWGIDIASFPVFLSTMNLSLQDISCEENYPTIIKSDFLKVRSNTRFTLINLDITHQLDVQKLDGKFRDVKMPLFDTCIGNPPYIRQELIHNKDDWNKLINNEFNIKKINQQSDLYVYYLIHTTAFLRNGCRLGYVISSSWLDVNFGAGLQKFLLDNFKIIAIIENQAVRSFSTASINTIILIIEKCSVSEQRNNHFVKFVRVNIDYKDIIRKEYDENRIKDVFMFVNDIEKTKKSIKRKYYSLLLKKQSELLDESTFNGKYINGHWGAKYLRASAIYDKIFSKKDGALIPLFNVCDVKYGIKSGANDFFYLKDDTEQFKRMSDEEVINWLGSKINNKEKFFAKYGWYYSELMKRHYILEKQFFQPLFKTQKEAKNLDVSLEKLNYVVLICNFSKRKLKSLKYKILDYINDAENHELHPHNRPTCASRLSEESGTDWFMLGEDIPVGDFIFPSKIGEKYRLIDNRKAKVYTDKVNYNIIVRDKYKKYSYLIFLYLNSTVFRYFLDLFSRQLTGNQTLSDIDVNLVEKTLILKPELLAKKEKDLKNIYNSLKSREQSTIFNEIKYNDRRKLDELIFDMLGLESDNVEELYSEVIKFIENRKIKSVSVVTSKNKKKLTYSDAVRLIKEKFDDIVNYSVLIKGMKCIEYQTKNLPVRFPSNYHYDNGNMFDNKIYVNYIIDDKRKFTLAFENTAQVRLFEFLVTELQINDIKVKIPAFPDEAKKVLSTLKENYNKYVPQIKSLLKQHRINASEIIIFRNIVFNL